MDSIREVNAGVMASVGAKAAQPPTILVAEDQDDVLIAIGLLLKGNGFGAELVKSPAEALKIIEYRSVDAVLLDLNYGRDTTSGSEGLELLSKIQALDPTLPVVVMTAWGTIELAVDAMHRGACDFVQKPWDNAQLLRVLQEHVQRSRKLRQQRFNDELEQQDAAQIQRALLPSEFSAPDGLTVVAATQSARSLGGDYYDVIRLGERRLAICIADVIGKGMGAALMMSNLQAGVRVLAPHIAEPQEICDRLNDAAAANGIPGKFITFFYCVIDLDLNRITYTNAGHNWPVLARADGSCERLTTEDAVLGTLRNWKYSQRHTKFQSGDRLVLFTDGISECAGEDGFELGEENLVELVRQNVMLSAEQIQGEILTSAQLKNQGRFEDDATLVVAALN